MRKQLNVRLLCWTLASLVVVGTCVHFLHAFQVRRNAGTLLRQAERALAKEQFARAAGYFNHYLVYEPGDNDAFVAYALALDRVHAAPAGRFRAFLEMEQALRRAPGRHDLRRRTVQTAIELTRYAEAARHLEALVAAFPDQADLEEQRGWCLDAHGDYQGAAAALARAVRKGPHRLESYVGLAAVLRHRLDQPDDAARVMDDMVAANAGSHRAYLLRARYHKERGALPDAARDVNRAAALAPDDADVLLTSAEVARAAGKPDDARRDLGRALERHSRDERLYRALADLELQAGRRAEAVACLRRGVAALPAGGGLVSLLADLLIDERQLSEAKGLIERLRREGGAPAVADSLEARTLMQTDRWAEARNLLERARTWPRAEAAWAGQVEMCLGQCYERLGEAELRLGAYHRAAALSPGLAQARLGLGATLLAAGAAAEAVTELRAAAARGAPPEVWPLLGRALLLRNLRTPARQRDWKEVETALARAEKASPGSPQVVLLRADLAAASGESDRAAALLEEASAARPGEPAYWIALADLAARQGRTDRARDILAAARKACGAVLEVRLAEVKYAASPDTAASRRALERLEKEPRDGLGTAEQVRLLRALAEAFHRAGARDDAERLWRQLAGQDLRDLNSRRMLFELAMQGGRDDTARAMLADLRRVEGDEGVLWRVAEAGWLIQRARRGERSGLADARKRLEEVKARHRDLARVPLLEAALDELEGRPGRAAEHYLRALEMGERHPVVVARAARLLYERHLFLEADLAIRAAEEQGPLTRDLARLAADIALANLDARRTLALARQAVDADSRDYRDHLWLAHALETAGAKAEAGKVLRHAAAIAPRIPDVWVALVRHLVRTGQAAQAEAAVEEARRSVPPERAALALARCEEAVGRPDRAEEMYRRFLATRPADFTVLRDLADYYLRADRSGKAEPHLRKLVDPGTRAPAEFVLRARRDLAVGLAAADPAAAQALLDRNTRERGQSAEDDRGRAFVLAAQPAHRKEALGLLKKLEKQVLPPGEQLLLARAYEAAGEAGRAGEVLANLAAAHGDSPQYLAHHLRVLIRRGDLAEARARLTGLERLEPRSPRTLELREALRQAEAREKAAEK